MEDATYLLCTFVWLCVCVASFSGAAKEIAKEIKGEKSKAETSEAQTSFGEAIREAIARLGRAIGITLYFAFLLALLAFVLLVIAAIGIFAWRVVFG